MSKYFSRFCGCAFGLAVFLQGCTFTKHSEVVAKVPSDPALYTMGSRTLILVPMAEGVAWQDMAYLAAVPAATVANGSPAVVALDANATLTSELLDYVSRYKPTRVVLLGNPSNDVKVGGLSCE